jgi:RimJ/RimL family protein N-acetyltransferase
VQGWENGSRAGFGIVDCGVFLGMCALIRIEWEAAEAELGYVVAPPARGRGAARRSIDLISRWTFDELGLARLDAVIDLANNASLRVAERAGYSREGVRRSAYFKDGVRADLAIYSLLPGELPQAPAPPTQQGGGATPIPYRRGYLSSADERVSPECRIRVNSSTTADAGGRLG